MSTKWLIKRKLQEIYVAVKLREISLITFGRADNASYPGDKEFCSNSVVSVQFHHIILDDPGLQYGKKDLFNLAFYYPLAIGEDFIRLDKPVEDDDSE